MHNDIRIKQIDRQIMLTNIIDTPFTLLLGLALYARFGQKDADFLPLLNDPILLNTLLGVSIGVMIFSGIQIFKLNREKRALLAAAK